MQRWAWLVLGWVTAVGIKISRSQWPSGLRRESPADPLVGLRVRIPPGIWVFVFCVLSKGKIQDNQDKETSTDEVKNRVQKNTKKNSCGREIFRICPDRLWGPSSRPGLFPGRTVVGAWH